MKGFFINSSRKIKYYWPWAVVVVIASGVSCFSEYFNNPPNYRNAVASALLIIAAIWLAYETLELRKTSKKQLDFAREKALAEVRVPLTMDLVGGYDKLLFLCNVTNYTERVPLNIRSYGFDARHNKYVESSDECPRMEKDEKVMFSFDGNHIDCEALLQNLQGIFGKDFRRYRDLFSEDDLSYAVVIFETVQGVVCIRKRGYLLRRGSRQQGNYSEKTIF